MKTFFLVVTPNYPNQAKIDASLCRAVECRPKDAERLSDDYERELNGGMTYPAAFQHCKESPENFAEFSSRQWFKVEPLTYAQARDYGSFSQWPCLIELESKQ